MGGWRLRSENDTNGIAWRQLCIVHSILDSDRRARSGGQRYAHCFGAPRTISPVRPRSVRTTADRVVSRFPFFGVYHPLLFMSLTSSRCIHVRYSSRQRDIVVMHSCTLLMSPPCDAEGLRPQEHKVAINWGTRVTFVLAEEMKRASVRYPNPGIPQRGSEAFQIEPWL